jgi:Tfp pilus assembly protein PilX
MVFSLIEKKLKNEDGIVSILSLMVLVTLTVAGIVAIELSSNETSIVRNEQLSNIEFYEAETGINDARVNYRNWLTDDFLTDGPTVASSTPTTIATCNSGNPMATIQVRCIENGNAGDVTPIFNNIADQMPAMDHTGPPPEGSGFSLKYFETHRYSLTSTSSTGSTIIQAGVWKAFNKY